MLDRLKKIRINVLLLAFTAHIVKMIAISPTFPDAIVFLVLSALYGFSLKIDLMRPKTTETEKLKAEIQELKNAVTKVSMTNATKPQKYF